jgi:uncharacterized protein (DUF342 family)
MEKLKIENVEGWVKDPASKAILNTDLSSLEQYKINRRKNMLINNMEEDLTNVKNELEELKTDIKDIKNILLQFIKPNL